MKQKFEGIQMLLQPINHAINGAKFEFIGKICNDNGFRYFTDNSMLLAHLEKEMIPICNACRSYKFEIYFLSDYSSTTNVISTILQFGPIDGCSEVLFNLRCFSTEIPVMSIVNLLNRTITTGQAKKERILEIKSISFSNLLALVNGLKKVNFNYFCHKK